MKFKKLLGIFFFLALITTTVFGFSAENSRQGFDRNFTNLHQVVSLGKAALAPGSLACFLDSSRQAFLSGQSGNTGGLKNIYDSIKKAPNYPSGFKAVQNGLKKLTVENKGLLDKLRNIEAGKWVKVYKDGFDQFGRKISIHYFESSSGKVFDVAVKSGWSNF